MDLVIKHLKFERLSNRVACLIYIQYQCNAPHPFNHCLQTLNLKYLISFFSMSADMYIVK